jgi:ring-1,2-phenylacetyl-CoA epoxidase subunit PaaD
MLTIEDLGILRSVDVTADGIVVAITPTYSGCPAMHEISADVRARLNRAGFERVTVATQLAPAWSSDWITREGHRKLAAAGIAPPSPAPHRGGPIPLTLGPPLTLGRPASPRCPRCDSADTRLTAQFSSTACKSLHRCDACGEPFEGVKAL